MMDIALIHTENGLDINFNSIDFEKDETLQTAILISLFSHQRHNNQKGWWGDTLSKKFGDKIGSNLWSLRREKMTQEKIKRVEEAAKSCLSWLIDDKIISSLEVKATPLKNEAISLSIKLNRDGKDLSFNHTWNGELR